MIYFNNLDYYNMDFGTSLMCFFYCEYIYYYNIIGDKNMEEKKYFITSESVSDGHPDKICDQISDAILDACLSQDANSLVAAEVAAFNNTIILGGEISTTAVIDFEQIVRTKIAQIGYNDATYGIEASDVEIINKINKQSQEIQDAVLNTENIGAGDQGIMFGYATNETSNFLPLGLDIANQLLIKQKQVRTTNTNLKPDAKAQVTIQVDENLKPVKIDTILISTQHAKDISLEDLQKLVKEEIIDPVLVEFNLYNQGDINFIINPSGSFVVGGPKGDAGLTGRKIIVDTYGGLAKHGGGAFSGKDATKVDRSAAYMARYLAKNIVGAGITKRCEIQLSYGIGIAEPISIYVDAEGDVDTDKIISAIKSKFTLTPKEMIEHLNLRQPIFSQTSAFGHFGKENLPWEQLDCVDLFKNLK